MMGAGCRCDLIATSLIVLFAVSCSGSDIGPRLPDVSTKVQLLDDHNRGVVFGRASVVGTTIGALTGRNGRGDFLAAPRSDI